jgi:hypothetical protein
MAREIIYRVTLGNAETGAAPQLSDYQRFVREAKGFCIPPETPVEVVPSAYYSPALVWNRPLMVQRVEVISDDSGTA